jgi:hypothetical protein
LATGRECRRRDIFFAALELSFKLFCWVRGLIGGVLRAKAGNEVITITREKIPI